MFDSSRQARAALIGCLVAVAFGVLGSTDMAVAVWAQNHRMAVFPNPCPLCDILGYVTGAIAILMVVAFAVLVFIAISRVAGGYPRNQ